MESHFLMYLKAGCDCKATSTSEFFLLKKFDMEDVLPNSKIIEVGLCVAIFTLQLDSGLKAKKSSI